MADLTAIVLTKDEEKNLPDCLSSLRGFASRVVVVDSGSTDRTVDIAREYGADVFTHPCHGDAHPFTWGLDNAGIDTEWVLRIDADERMTEAVKAECAPILATKRESGVGGITMEADFYMLGRRLRFGGAKKRKLMIFRNGWAASKSAAWTSIPCSPRATMCAYAPTLTTTISRASATSPASWSGTRAAR